MAQRDDVRRVLAACEECGSVYTAWLWPDGALKVIGQEGCSCGSTAFTVLDDDSDSTPASGAE
ncbi:hypothetical protein [Halosolutus gelatinilyticus]|uniref:hypothetical protein n=1 Tax=Halosolutus gelatinilyticus TaxID=2931975 RepID=UPI001FF3393E|nr:hypothetical protein [Halosolutus gelatinilyticus]